MERAWKFTLLKGIKENIIYVAVHTGLVGRLVSGWQRESNKIQALKRGDGQATAGTKRRKQGGPESRWDGLIFPKSEAAEYPMPVFLLHTTKGPK